LSGRAVAVLLGLLSVIVFTGCYGSTEPATDVGTDSATLKAQGTANNGPATAYFEYWVTGASGSTQQTDPLHFPGGARGPFSTRVTGLAPDTSYSFRVCGSDDAGGSPVCAQVRTFRTLPIEDYVTGYFDLGSTQGTIDAHSGPSGENPRGEVHYEGTIDGWRTFDGEVTCVAVNGNRGAVGAVGEGTLLADPSSPRPGTLLINVVDGKGVSQDSIAGDFNEGSTPPDCGATLPFGQFPVSPPESELVVGDAPASIPASAR
jgi:hypothetical protein